MKENNEMSHHSHFFQFHLRSKEYYPGYLHTLLKKRLGKRYSSIKYSRYVLFIIFDSYLSDSMEVEYDKETKGFKDHTKVDVITVFEKVD